MQHQLSRGSFCTRRLCIRNRPSLSQSGLRLHRLTRNAAGTAEAAEQPSTSADDSTHQSGSASATPVTVVEASVVEPEEGHTDRDAPSASTSENAWRDALFPEVPLSTSREAGWQYAALGGAYAVAGGAVAVAALRSPQSLFPSAAASAVGGDPWVGTLLGCLAATYLRAAGVFLHLKAAADAGELLAWRHQRLAAATAVYGIVAAASQLAGVASAPLAGLQALLAAATAFVVLRSGRQLWSVRPFVSAITDLGQGSRLVLEPQEEERAGVLTEVEAAAGETAAAAVAGGTGALVAEARAAGEEAVGVSGQAFAASSSSPSALQGQQSQEEQQAGEGSSGNSGSSGSSGAVHVDVELQPGGVLAECWRAAGEAVSSVAGVLLLGVAGLSLCGFVHIVFAGAPALSVTPFGAAWPGQPLTLPASAAALRRLVGAGLLLTAATAHGLLDFAVNVRQPPPADDLAAVKRVMLIHLARTKDRLAKYYLPDPATFRVLNLVFIAAAVLQAFFVVRAPGLGVDVNWDGPLWGSMYGTWIMVLSYGLVALTSFDWGSVADTVLRLFGWGAAGVLAFFNAFVWRFEWAEKPVRK